MLFVVSPSSFEIVNGLRLEGLVNTYPSTYHHGMLVREKDTTLWDGMLHFRADLSNTRGWTSAVQQPVAHVIRRR